METLVKNNAIKQINEFTYWVVDAKALRSQNSEKGTLPKCLSHHMTDMDDRLRVEAVQKALDIRIDQQNQDKIRGSYWKNQRVAAWKKCAGIIGTLKKFEREVEAIKGEAVPSSMLWAITERSNAFTAANKEFKQLHGYGFYVRHKFSSAIDSLI